ncbi:MAG: response regulator [Acidobacteriota bacterium]|nr:response regulator [Acidobacteriota bacterium]
MPRTLIAVVDDMFFVSKIQATAKALGVIVRFPRTLDAAREAASEETPDLVVVDLHNQKLSPLELARKFKTDERLQNIPLLGFFSHVQVELQKQAVEAGYDQIVPRSVFARDLADILAGSSKT